MKKIILINLALIFALFVNAQNLTLKGTVISNEDGSPIVGATVKEKKTGKGTITNTDGKFSFNCTQKEIKLEISYVGMKSQEVLCYNGIIVRMVTGKMTDLHKAIDENQNTFDFESLFKTYQFSKIKNLISEKTYNGTIKDMPLSTIPIINEIKKSINVNNTSLAYFDDNNFITVKCDAEFVLVYMNNTLICKYKNSYTAGEYIQKTYYHFKVGVPFKAFLRENGNLIYLKQNGSSNSLTLYLRRKPDTKKWKSDILTDNKEYDNGLITYDGKVVFSNNPNLHILLCRGNNSEAGNYIPIHIDWNNQMAKKVYADRDMTRKGGLYFTKQIPNKYLMDIEFISENKFIAVASDKVQRKFWDAPGHEYDFKTYFLYGDIKPNGNMTYYTIEGKDKNEFAQIQKLKEGKCRVGTIIIKENLLSTKGFDVISKMNKPYFILNDTIGLITEGNNQQKITYLVNLKTNIKTSTITFDPNPENDIVLNGDIFEFNGQTVSWGNFNFGAKQLMIKQLDDYINTLTANGNFNEYYNFISQFINSDVLNINQIEEIHKNVINRSEKNNLSLVDVSDLISCKKNDYVQRRYNEYKQEFDKAKKYATNNGLNFVNFIDGFYYGKMNNNERNGQGTFVYKSILPRNEYNDMDNWNDNIRVTGEWKNDKLNGHAKLEFRKTYMILGVTKSDVHYFSGDFVNGNIEGRGYFDGDLCVFSNGKLIRNLSEEARLKAYIEKKAKEDCANCIINEDKTVFPKEEEKDGWFGKYTQSSPGKIVMKNSEVYEYWFDKGNDKPWRIIESHGLIFNDYKNFKTFDEMATALIEKCINAKCKTEH